ncbi:hypothetical protein KY359_03005 [Candidatus Woesearchaeota archaeon]|nr:hypothetical protein [Candidatus Woesearchaeota archaeon]
MAKPEEYSELDAPPVRKDEMHPRRMRRFITHLASAANLAEERSVKKQKIKEKVESIKAVSLNKRSTKQMIEHELGSFEDVVQEIIHDEEKILEEQRRETKQINELRSMVENLSKKLIGIGREYAQELESKDRKIMELREALAAAHIKISESGEERQKKIEDIERRLQQKQAVPPRPKSKSEHISEVEAHLRSLEERHRDLKRMGVHSKDELDRVQQIIDKHKASLAKAKGIELPAPKPPVAAPKPAVTKPKPAAKPKPKAKPKPAAKKPLPKKTAAKKK